MDDLATATTECLVADLSCNQFLNTALRLWSAHVIALTLPALWAGHDHDGVVPGVCCVNALL